jgi:hypothetical protein
LDDGLFAVGELVNSSRMLRMLILPEVGALRVEGLVPARRLGSGMGCPSVGAGEDRSNDGRLLEERASSTSASVEPFASLRPMSSETSDVFSVNMSERWLAPNIPIPLLRNRRVSSVALCRTAPAISASGSSPEPPLYEEWEEPAEPDATFDESAALPSLWPTFKCTSC